MIYSRRGALALARGAALAPMISSRAFALDWPTRVVHWVNSTAPGGSGDITARLIGEYLSSKLGQPFIIDDKPGAGVNVATDAMLKAPADGYTLLILTKGNIIASRLYANTDYDFFGDIAPVAMIHSGPLIMLVNASTPVNTIPEFIAYAKANPEKINFGSAGNGTDPHLSGELLKLLSGAPMTHVPYRGGALAMTDLLAGQIQVFFSNLPSADYVKAGKLRALGVSSAERSALFPDLPAISEFVPGFDCSVWFGVGVRKGTPAEIIERLNAEVASSLTDAKVKAGIAVMSGAPTKMTPEAYGEFLVAEADKWGKVIAAANIKPQ